MPRLLELDTLVDAASGSPTVNLVVPGPKLGSIVELPLDTFPRWQRREPILVHCNLDYFHINRVRVRIVEQATGQVQLLLVAGIAKQVSIVSVSIIHLQHYSRVRQVLIRGTLVSTLTSQRLAHLAALIVSGKDSVKL